MPESDCYCAICGTCIREFSVGSSSAKAQRVRGIALRNGYRERAEKHMSILEQCRLHAEMPLEDCTESDPALGIMDEEHAYNLEHSYDPQVLEGHDTSWIPEVLLIANDPRKRRAPRTFICGPANFDDNGYCQGNSYEGEKYGVMDYDCERLPLYDYDELFHGGNHGLGTYPCHVPCLKILARAITGTTMDFLQLDPYVLHRTMHSLDNRDLSGLDVDYGEVEGRNQFWESYPGEEFSVINPLEPIPVNDAMMLSFILKEERKSVEQSLDDNHVRVEHDPFCKLPTELIQHVTNYMEGHEIISLRDSSRSIRQATSSQGFWKRLLVCEQSWLWDTPFSLDFWETSPSSENTVTPAQLPIDWEKLYVVLEKSTTKCFGMKGRYMGLANRRRIWKVCEKMASVYWGRFWPQKDDIRDAERLADPFPPPDNSRAWDYSSSEEEEEEAEAEAEE